MYNRKHASLGCKLEADESGMYNRKYTSLGCKLENRLV